MRMIEFVFALLAAAPPPGPVRDSCGLQPLGWTSDGSFFVYKQAQTLYAAGDPEGVRVVFAMVMDAAAGAEERYLLEPTGKGPDDHARLARLELPTPQGDAFAEWQKQHPLQGPDFSRACGSSPLEVCGRNSLVVWKDGGFAFSAAGSGPVELEASMSVGGAASAAARWRLHGTAQKAGAMRGQVLGACSPNRQRVAWLSCRSGDEAGGAAQPPESRVLLGL